MEDLSFRHVTARVAKILLEQEGSTKATPRAYHMIQQEMAALAGTAREVIGRSLKELVIAGAIEKRQGHAVVLNRDRLLLLASE